MTSLWLAGHFLLNVHDLEANLLWPDIASRYQAFCCLWQAKSCDDGFGQNSSGLHELA